MTDLDHAQVNEHPPEVNTSAWSAHVLPVWDQHHLVARQLLARGSYDLEWFRVTSPPPDHYPTAYQQHAAALLDALDWSAIPHDLARELADIHDSTELLLILDGSALDHVYEQQREMEAIPGYRDRLDQALEMRRKVEARKLEFDPKVAAKRKKPGQSPHDIPGDPGPAGGQGTDGQPDKAPSKPFSIFSWRVSEAFVGDPPEREYLVDKRFPMGQPALVSAAGETGKSGMFMDLGKAITFEDDGLFQAFGGDVLRKGTAVLYFGEDDHIALHNNLKARDALRSRKLIAVPVPSAGGTTAFFRQDATRQPVVTDAWKQICDELITIPDLRMFGLDPLQVVCLLDLNLPENAQFVCSQLSALASETGAAVLVSHHMRKSKVTGPESAREAIRGTTGLVDGVRCAYALWPQPEDAGKGNPKAICRYLGRPYEPGKIVQGAVVKANNAACRWVSTFYRDNSGILYDVTEQVRIMSGVDVQDMLVECVRESAVNGKPYTRTGGNGPYERRHEFPEELQLISKHKLAAIIDDLLERQLLVLAMGPGSSVVKWLDVPDGPFARGVGDFQRGANS